MLNERTRAVLAAEHDLATLTGQIARTVIRDSKRAAAEWYSHQQNRETLLMIRRIVAAYAALKDTDEMPTDFYTTRYLAAVSMRLMETLESVTGDPMALFRRIRERERLMFGCLFRRDDRILAEHLVEIPEAEHHDRARRHLALDREVLSHHRCQLCRHCPRIIPNQFRRFDRARKNATTPQARSIALLNQKTGCQPNLKTSVSARAVQMPPPMNGSCRSCL